MADSTTHLDLISESQSGKATAANGLLDAASPAMFGARRASACSGLTWGYYGGWLYKYDGSLAEVANGTLSLTASATNRVYLKLDGTIGVVTGTTAAADELILLYAVVTGVSTVTSYEDHRFAISQPWMVHRASVDVAAGNATVSGATRRAGYLTVTGALTVNRNVIVPNDWHGYVYNNTSGAYTVTVKTSGGSGIVVAQTKRAKLFADGTNVVRLTADV
jgi:hypothetical protein